MPTVGLASALTLAFGIPGIKPLVVIAIVAFALYGRSGHRLLGMTRYGRMLQPFLDMVPGRSTAPPTTRPSRPTPPFSLPRKRGLLFWVLVATATVALAGVIATRIAIHSSIGVSH
jgi:hypothetical protein